jgi:hypothetical protein
MTMAIGDTIGNGATQGSVLFVGPSGVLAQNNSNLFWDNSNQRLGIGTISPSDGLTVRKSSSTTVGIDSINSNTTSPTANAQVFVGVAGANAGDPVTVYDIPGAARWTVGVDNDQSDKFKIACSGPAGFVTPMTVTTDGNVGVDEVNPTARLHIASGTASLPALKLTAGAKLTSPQAGDLEFDGTQFWITQTGGQRRSLIPYVANVVDFGAKGDGATDDSAAIQAAVNSLVNTGGIVYLPANLMYKVNSSIDIRSNFAIWIVSDMHHGQPVGSPPGPGPSIGKGYVQPGMEITNGIFRWRRPDGNAAGRAGGGGLRHVTIADPPLPGNQIGRNTTIDAAVWIEDAGAFDIQDCFFDELKGSAIKMGVVTVCRVRGGRIYRCGDSVDSTARPAVHVEGGGVFAGAYIDDAIIEGSHKAPSVRAEALTWLNIRNSYFESNTYEPELQHPFIDSLTNGVGAFGGACSLVNNTFGILGSTVTQVSTVGGYDRIIGNVFLGAGRAISCSSAAQFAEIRGNTIRGAGGSSVDSMTIAGNQSRVLNNEIDYAGRASITGQSCLVAGNRVFEPRAGSSQGAIEVTHYSLVAGNYIDGNNASVCNGIGVSGGWAHNIAGNYITGLNGGTAIVADLASLVRDNYGYPDQLVFSNTVASTPITNTAVETAFDQFYTIPAKRLRAGDVIRVRAQGVALSTNANDTLDIRLQIGSQQVLATGPVDVSNDDIFLVDAEVIIRATGSPGTLVGTGWTALGPLATTAKARSLGGGFINTALARDVTITATWSAASSNNSVRLDVLTVEILSK